MDVFNNEIDGGKGFDWGRTSSDYAKYRDIYPQEFFDRIARRGLCVKGQKVLDLGTGTGVVPRYMYHYGAEWVGSDISENQIAQAKILAEQAGMDIRYIVSPAEKIDLPDNSFDVITACQCFFYFDHEKIVPELARLLKDGGRLVILYMAWIPAEDRIAGESERLVLKYNPQWTGAGYTRSPVFLQDALLDRFELESADEYDLDVPFTRESWNGRMKACRGVGASMNEQEIAAWEEEHLKMLESSAPPEFAVLHHAATAVLKRK